jgi:hypothetical protein
MLALQSLQCAVTSAGAAAAAAAVAVAATRSGSFPVLLTQLPACQGLPLAFLEVHSQEAPVSPSLL